MYSQDLLLGALDSIQERRALDLDFDGFYNFVYNHILGGNGTELYQALQNKFSDQHKNMAEVLAATNNSTLLEETVRMYREFLTTMRLNNDLLMYVNASYVRRHNRKPIRNLMIHLYRTIVWDKIKGNVVNLILENIANERVGNLTDDKNLLKSLVDMLKMVGEEDSSHIYEEDLEQSYIDTTREFYKVESYRFLAENSASDYVAKALARLEEEKTRWVTLALPWTTVRVLDKLLKEELVEEYATRLVDMPNSGFKMLLQGGSKMNEMTQMYDLLSKVPSTLDLLRTALAERVTMDGESLFEELEKNTIDANEFIEKLLKMTQKYQNILKDVFHGEGQATRLLQMTFEAFLNKNTRVSSCLASYANNLMKKELNDMSKIDDVVVVLRYISDKDIFEEIYREHLAKRLLSRKTLCNDAEKTMIGRLKQECGFQFTSKLEKMFSDMTVSGDLQRQYTDYKLQNHSGGKIDLDATILTCGIWSMRNQNNCQIPPVIEVAIQDYMQFYSNKFNNRRLQWLTSQGTAEMKATFKNEKKFLTVTTYQMSILLLFNENDTLTYREIKEATNIPDAELKQHLMSLTNPNYNILNWRNKEKGIFQFNELFKHNKKKITIPLGKKKKVDKNASEIPDPVKKDREQLISATIVRIMKARKQLKHQDLSKEVMNQLKHRFKPTGRSIKKQIENLIENEYLESEEHRRSYKYLA